MNKAKAEKKKERLLDLVINPYEDPGIEYKPAGSFSIRNNGYFTARLIKEIVGFSNAGGGTIVVGVKEFSSGSKRVLIGDDTLSEDIWSTYDITQVRRAVNSFIATSNHAEELFTIDLIPFEGKKYPIFSIFPFTSDPIFCVKNYPSDTCNEDKCHILESGRIYLRTNAGEIVRVSDTEHWKQLIHNCINVKKIELAQAMKNVLDQFGLIITEEKKPSLTKSKPYKRPNWIDNIIKKTKKDVTNG
ncbi:MAG: RNA-binding domain-containing protein [bacterium]|nr:putative DNA binding domain-containing protein [Dehalococcoidales bacterium]